MSAQSGPDAAGMQRAAVREDVKYVNLGREG